MQKYSVTEIHNHLSTLIHQMEETGIPIELTQHDKTIAVLVPKREYDELTKVTLSPWEALMAFREQTELESLNIEPDIFNERKVQEYERKFDF